MSLFAVPGDAVATTADDCYTPRWVFDAMGLRFDLDVAAPVLGPPHVPAARWYTPADDGLTQPWEGLVWCNPPFSKSRPWVERWAAHPTGVLLIPYGPELYATKIWAAAADAVALVSPVFTRPGGGTIKPRMGVVAAFRGVGTRPAELLAAADVYGGVLYGRPA